MSGVPSNDTITATELYGLTDAELVVLVLNSSDSFVHIVRRFEHQLRRYVRRVLGSHAAATEDVLQEVFLKAYVNLNGFDQRLPMSPWLYRIAHNEAVSVLRKRKAGPNVIGGDDAALLIDRIAAPSTGHAEQGIDDHIQKTMECINGLETKFRDVLVLRYLEEKSYHDIGNILRLPPGTVATLIRRGLLKLRAVLDAQGMAVGDFD